MTTASAPSTLTYAPPLSPSEFDQEFDAERVRWLRRRLIIFCLISIALSALWATIILRASIGRAGGLHSGDNVRLAGAAIDIAFYAAGIVIALLVKLNRRAIPLLALVLSAAVGAFDVLQDRIAAQYDMAARLASHRELWSMAIPFNVILDHLVPCLIIPWTLLECLIPAAAILGTAIMVIAYDASLGQGTAREAIPLIPALVATVPGVLVCWLRFSKFRRLFKLRFESGRYRELQLELGGARRLLEACLPPPLDRGPVRFDYAYEPMRQIGGDLLFIHPPTTGVATPATDGALSAIVLDVTGHGIAAALTVSRFVGELERLFAERPDASPADVLRNLNHYCLLTLARHGIFATAICLRLDPRRGEIEWASGGHPAAFLCHANGTEAPADPATPRIEPLECTGPMLGVLGGEEFELETCRRPFAPGDVVVAYTDGASEAADPQGRQLGIRGVQEFIRQAAGAFDAPPREWPGRLLRGVTAHRQAPPRDDTLLVALYRPAAEPSGVT